MKKLPLMMSILCVIYGNAIAQTSEEKDVRDQFNSGGVGHAAPTALTESGKNAKARLTNDALMELSKQYIPSIIANTGMATANFDNIGFTFGDDKFNFTKGIGNNFGLKINADAPNGSFTIFKPGQAAYVYSGELKYTFGQLGSKWFLLNNDGTVSDKVSSTRQSWFNVTGSLSQSSLPLFSSDSTYEKKHETAFELLLSWNGVFNSLYVPKYIRERMLWSIGAGIGKLNNYQTLDEITLEPGTYYSHTGAFAHIDDKVEGRKGNFKSFVGPVFRGAVFAPLLSPFSLTNVSLGITANSAGAFSSKHMLHGTAGIYFSKRHWDTNIDENPVLICNDNNIKNCHIVSRKKLVEDFSVGLICSWKNIQNMGNENYAVNNFRILLSAQIPLKF